MGISDVNHTFMGRAVFLNLWHGVPLKKVGYDDDKVKNWDSKGQKNPKNDSGNPIRKRVCSSNQ